MPDTKTLSLLAALASPKRRRETAATLARHLRADDLIIFICDTEMGMLLPAPGFQQTLPNGRLWHTFLGECSKQEYHTGTMPYGDATEPKNLRGISAGDGSVLVLIGGSPDPEELDGIRTLLPILAAAFRGEQISATATTQAKMARDAAAQARSLAETLDATRSDLQRALGVAEAANRAKDEFLAIVSHELRAPLNAILGWSQLLLNSDLDKETVEHAIETIERNARAQAELTEEILDYERIIAGKIRLDIKQLHLSDIVHRALDVVRPAADARQITISTTVDSTPRLFNGDAGRLRQVLWNLLSNAIKFTPIGGGVSITLGYNGSVAEIQVTDTGEGITTDFLPHIFDRFRQADSTTTRRHGGLGLGLAIARHLVELHGGMISANSKGKGQGATFTIRLPGLVALPAATVRPTEGEKPVTRYIGQQPRKKLNGLRILIVDDIPDALDLLGRLLAHHGAEVDAASSAAEAIELYDRQRPDVIVSDIEMPEEDGNSLLRRIREREGKARPTPAIALTAHTRPTDRAYTLSAGFQLHMTKPLRPADLIDAIAGLTQNYDQRGLRARGANALPANGDESRAEA